MTTINLSSLIIFKLLRGFKLLIVTFSKAEEDNLVSSTVNKLLALTAKIFE